MAGAVPSERILLVEGGDDEHVVSHLCSCREDIPEYSIRNSNGFPRLKDAIGPEIKVSGRTALGVLADADEYPNRRWQAIVEQLRRVGVNPPNQIVSGGAIVGDNPRVGSWLMPDNKAPGQLEDFIESLIPVGDPVWPRAQRYVERIPSADRKFSANKVVRAKVHAWLATRREPRRMGSAIGTGDLDSGARPAVEFIDWLRRLFG